MCLGKSKRGGELGCYVLCAITNFSKNCETALIVKERALKSSSLSCSHEEEQEAGGGELVKRRELYAYLLKSFERQEPLGQNRLFFFFFGKKDESSCGPWVFPHLPSLKDMQSINLDIENAR